MFASHSSIITINNLLTANKGFWGEVMGVGDFYYELAVQIIEFALATRPQNGGLIELSTVKQELEKSRRDRNLSE